MWSCGKCGESVDADLGVCWNCGTTREGVEDPEFVKVQDTAPETYSVCALCGAELDVIRVGELSITHCSDCRLLEELGAEGTLICPRDGTEMGKDLYRGIIVDRCPQCGGVWLDEGELEAIEDQVGEDSW